MAASTSIFFQLRAEGGETGAETVDDGGGADAGVATGGSGGVRFAVTFEDAMEFLSLSTRQEC
jgi:hypothetical protein